MINQNFYIFQRMIEDKDHLFSVSYNFLFHNEAFLVIYYTFAQIYFNQS